MCSVAGIILESPNEKYIADRISIMNATMKHRGPDGDGIWISDSGRIGLGHNRLAIIDLSEFAAQPLLSSDGRFTICFNGEIYNHETIRSDCESLGSEFRTTSDTEVIAEAFRHWGNQCWPKLRGMWAVAIYDDLKNQLTLSRDYFGIKPLYYSSTQKRVVFASEPKALRIAFSELAEVDEQSIQDFIERGTVDRGDWTFFKNISRFPSGNFSTIDLLQPLLPLVFTPFWKPPTTTSATSTDAKVYADELARLFQISVKRHLTADVPVGTCLSGGVDSSAITFIANKIGRHQNRTLTTFTTAFPDFPEIDESQKAKQFAQSIDALSITTEPTYENFEQNIDRVLYFQDEPFGTTSIFSQYFIFKRVNEAGYKVVLDGQGADEIFGGYVGLIPLYLKGYIFQHGMIKCLFDNFKLIVRYSISPSTVWACTKEASLARRELSRVKQSQYPRRTLAPAPTDFNDYLKYLVTEGNLPQLLRYEDRNSMANSVESRVPFLDVDFLDYALTVPTSIVYYKGYTKGILRAALASVLPSEILYNKKKLGFPAPEIHWLSRLFKKPVTTVGGKDWRLFVVARWRAMLARDWTEFV